MEIVDKTGQPGSDEDLQDAINCITQIMIKHPLVLPLLTVHAGIIHRCLLELRKRRQLAGTFRMENYIRGLTWAKSLYRTLHSGGCNILSLGDDCKCFLCQIDNEILKLKRPSV